MVMDHQFDEWYKKYKPVSPGQTPNIYSVPRLPSQAEIDEFYRLLERAREYDKRNNEPECELESKKQKLRDLAKELGFEIEIK